MFVGVLGHVNGEVILTHVPISTSTHTTPRSQSTHSKGACESPDYDVEVVWVEVEKMPIAVESIQHKNKPCQAFGHLPYIHRSRPSYQAPTKHL